MVAAELEGARPSLTRRPPWDPSRRARRLGLTGSLLMAIGALGSGALPVPNPLFGLRVLGLPARNATLAIAVTYAGIGLVVLAWLWVGKMLRYRGAVAPAPNRAQLARTAILWALPLAVAPPMFSRDVYSYLAQSAILARHLDPYVLGPAEALGVDDPLTRSIPTIWRDTPAPYGPLFLILGRGITAISGNDVVLGVLEHRALALCGVAMIVWALPRLANRCALDPGLALWLGAANPLVLFHLVSGIHNESLMIGLLLVGLEVGLRAGPRLLDRHLLGRHRPDRRGVRGQAAGVARPGLPGAGVGPPPGRERARRGRGGRRDGRHHGRHLHAAVGGHRGRAGLDQDPGHPVADPELDVGLDRPRADRRPGRHPRWPRRPHRHGAPAHPRGRLRRGGGGGRHAAAGHAARADRRRHRRRGRVGRRGAARTGGAPLVPAVGGDPAGRHPRPAAAPAGRARRVGRAGHRGPADRGRLQLPRLPAADRRGRGAGDAVPRAVGAAPAAGRARPARTSTRCPAARRSRSRHRFRSRCPARRLRPLRKTPRLRA